MNIFGQSRFFERVFLGVILLTLWSFAYYFTSSDIEEVQSRLANKRVVLIKLLAREITQMLNRREEVEPRLSNLLAEEPVAYAIVQQPEGEILARASTIPVESLQKIEADALKTSHLRFYSFLDPSGIVPLIEGSMPIFTENGRKAVLRIGFHRAEEDERTQQILFRNILLFSTLVLGLGSYWFIRRKGASGFQSAWLGATGLLVLILFLSVRFTIQEWYDKNWRQNSVQQGMALAKVMAVPVKRFFHGGDEKDLKDLQSILDLDDNYAYMGVIKDELYLFHSDPNFKGKAITDPSYTQILNTDKPFLYNKEGEDLYEALIPIIDGQRRLGTFQLAFHNSRGFGTLSQLRNRVVLLFAATLFLALCLVYLISRRISKDVSIFIRSMEQVTAGDFKQNIYLDREDEFGQMAQAYNFMLMGLKERDVLSKGLQNYVSRSIVDKTLRVLSSEEKSGEKIFSVVIFGYFLGIPEAISRGGVPEVFAAIREVYQTFRRICGETSNAHIQVNLHGITALFFQSQRHEAVMYAMKAVQTINQTLSKQMKMPFTVRLTLHAQEFLHGTLDEDSRNVAFFGETVPDFKPLANALDHDGILISEEASYLLKEISNLEEIEIRTRDEGYNRAFVFKGFKAPENLVDLFAQSNSWTKVLILKLLKGYAREDTVKILVQWFADPDPDIRYHIMDVLERLRPAGIIDFIAKTVTDEPEPRVCSKAISVLGKIGNETHISLLAEKLRTGDRRVKANAVEALEIIGGKKVYEFLNLLVDEQDNRVKANILIALGKYGDLKVFDLLNRMIKDSDKNMRASAAYALGKLGMVQGVEPLIASLSDKDISVRRQVVASLTSLKADLEIDI